MGKVTIIPATIHPLTHKVNNSTVKRRTAAYARVSTDNEEQESSYQAQVDHYTKFINAREDLEFAGVYTDEGITGTSTKKRVGFMKMINDALAGKIDYIITKSISRFARNTLDTLTYIRMLKDKGIEIFFEKENIYTLDSKGELLITIMASLAQEESRSISENVTWGQRKSFRDGKVHLAYSHFLGYTKGENGKLELVPEEADTIRLIYRWFLEGKTTQDIANLLDEAKIKTPFGYDKWRRSTINSILQNEKYKGDALLQKSYTKDFLNHKIVKNNGEVEQVYVPDAHEAIISKEEWEQVQYQISERKKLGKKYSAKSVFLSKLYCGDCGELFGAKVWHSNDKYRNIVYRCNNKYNKEKRCQTPNIKEEIIEKAFVEAYNEFVSDKAQVIEDCMLVKETVGDTSQIEKKISEYEKEYEIVIDIVNKLVNDNSRRAMNQDEFKKKYEEYEKKYNSIVKKLETLKSEKAKKEIQVREIDRFIKDLENRPGLLDCWDQDIWRMFVDRATVYKDRRIVFKFFDGKEITKDLDNYR